MRLIGTGKAPDGQYAKGQVFDVPEHDEAQAKGILDKGWAKELAPRDDPGRSKVQIANAIVRNDMINDPVDRAIAREIGGHDNALAIVHAEDPNATPADYEAEVKEGEGYNAIGTKYDDEVLKVVLEDGEKSKPRVSDEEAAAKK